MKALRSTAIVVVAAGAMLAATAVMLASATTCRAEETAAVPTGRPQRITGTLRSVEQLPNVPGAKCGHHYDLTVAIAGDGRHVLHIYDMRVSGDSLAALKGRKVEIDFVAGGIVESIRAVGGRGNAVALSDLSTIKHC